MTTVNTPTGTLPTIPRYVTPAHNLGMPQSATGNLSSTTPALIALRAILAEVTPCNRPYSSDSYLPEHLVKAAQAALDDVNTEAHQHAFNALSTAAWHIARGEAPQALARLRRAQSHITASMEGAAS